MNVLFAITKALLSRFMHLFLLAPSTANPAMRYAKVRTPSPRPSVIIEGTFRRLPETPHRW